MATKRTSADLESNLFQDGQPAGSIVPLDMRDFVASMVQPFGSLSMVTPAGTTISAAGTYYKAAGVTGISLTVEEFDTGSVNNRLVYTGTPDRHFLLMASVSMVCASSNQVLGLKLAKNGVVLDDTIVRRKVGTGSDVGAAAVSGLVALSLNDYVELFVTNETSTAAVQIETMNMAAVGLFV
jgi:hypothetical protein